MMSLSVFLVSMFTMVELNCENLFDYRHDSLKNDYEYLPDATRHWNQGRYWKKLNNIGRTIIACGRQENGWQVPDLVALCEVENDSVLTDLTRRSLLRNARYDYLVTRSPDLRGIDVALLYSPYSFALLRHYSLGIEPYGNRRPTRDILYVQGETTSGDTLHIFIVHAPSRYGGELASRPYRMQVAQTLVSAIDSVRKKRPSPNILVAGDFNASLDNHSLRFILAQGLESATSQAVGLNGSPANYRYQGRWEQIDHVLVSPSLHARVTSSSINDAPFLLEPDEKMGGMKPFRTFNGYRYQPGFSDHLPLIVRFSF